MARKYVAALTRALPWLLAALAAAVLVVSAVLFISSSGFGYDFLAYDAAARRLAAGAPLYPPGTAEAYNSGAYSGLYLYAPPLAIALLPMAGLSLATATQAWLAGRILLLGLGCAILPVRREVRLTMWFVASVSFPVLYDLNLGNLSVALFALGAAIWRWNGTPWVGGALAAALTVRQSFVMVGIAWILTRRLRSIAGAAVATVLIVLATIPIVGIAGWTDYVTILRGLGDISTGPNNLSLGSAVSALGLRAPWTTMATLLGIAVPVVAVTAAARRRDPELVVVVALAGTLLFEPFFHPHYLVALLIPAAYVANGGRRWGYVLPLLGWLPGEVLDIVAIAGIVAPLVAWSLGRDKNRLANGHRPSLNQCESGRLSFGPIADSGRSCQPNRNRSGSDCQPIQGQPRVGDRDAGDKQQLAPSASDLTPDYGTGETGSGARQVGDGQQAVTDHVGSTQHGVQPCLPETWVQGPADPRCRPPTRATVTASRHRRRNAR